MNESFSFQQAAWKRLKKNKGALFGLIIIIISILIALFGYFIAPDHSPYANRIILEIGSGKPGFKQDFILLKKENPPTLSGFFQQLASGKEDLYYYIPVVSYREQGDSLIVQKYIDEGLSERQAFHKKDLATQPIKTTRFILGTDKFGRDILSRIIIGTRISLSVGLITVLISLSIGLILG